MSYFFVVKYKIVQPTEVLCENDFRGPYRVLVTDPGGVYARACVVPVMCDTRRFILE